MYVPQEEPSDAATAAQPEAASVSPAVVPQVDRTRKPVNNQKPEQEESLVKPVRIRSVA